MTLHNRADGCLPRSDISRTTIRSLFAVLPRSLYGTLTSRDSTERPHPGGARCEPTIRAAHAICLDGAYSAYLSQVVDGMDALLRVPSGCFEQTTSTAWPNVLVTAYLQQTKQLKPEVQLKAESLMSAGYQRLLTFEHAGGGYSWFGEQDPAPFPDTEEPHSKGLGSLRNKG